MPAGVTRRSAKVHSSQFTQLVFVISPRAKRLNAPSQPMIEREHDAVFKEPVLFALKTGRSLCLGPEWTCSDAMVLFDRYSGDYWVLSSMAVSTIKLLQNHHDLTLQHLEQKLCVLHSKADLAAEFLPTLRSLIDNGILQAVNWSAFPAVLVDDSDE